MSLKVTAKSTKSGGERFVVEANGETTQCINVEALIYHAEHVLNYRWHACFFITRVSVCFNWVLGEIMIWSYIYNKQLYEYAVFLNGSIFCHLSESDFDTFSEILTKAGMGFS
jgi:hypothetical protein